MKLQSDGSNPWAVPSLEDFFLLTVTKTTTGISLVGTRDVVHRTSLCSEGVPCLGTKGSRGQTVLRGRLSL